MKPVVIDASVWVAAVDQGDKAHAAARACLAAVAGQHRGIVVPALARVEVACALARRFGDGRAAHELAGAFFDAPFVHEEPIDTALATRASLVGTNMGLRAADAIYAAIADRDAALLVTLDRELLVRADGVTPEQWLASEA